MFTLLTLAGGAALAGSAANAQVIVVPVNETVGFNFGAGDIPGFISSLPGASQFAIFDTGTFFVHVVEAADIAGSVTVRGQFQNGFSYANTPFGKQFNTIIGPTFHSGPLVFSTSEGSAGNAFVGSFPSYLSFRFAPTTPGTYDYGWLELGGFGTPYDDAFVNIIDYAYDLTPGQQLPNGTVPEPSPAAALAAFGALALGAAGVRRLKALRAAA